MSETEGTFYVEVDIEGRSWMFRPENDKEKQIFEMLNAIVRKYGGQGSLNVEILMDEASMGGYFWEFSVPDSEEYKELEEKLDKLESTHNNAEKRPVTGYIRYLPKEVGDNDFDNLKEKVEYVLKRVPEARNSDYKLQYIIWREIDEIDDLNDFFQYRNASNPSMIKRYRAEIQNEDLKYPPTDPEVVKQRNKKEDRIEEYYALYPNTEENLEEYRSRKEG